MDIECYYESDYAKNQFLVECDKTVPDLRITQNNDIERKKILVIGVNTGSDVSFLTKKNEVFGIDIMSEAINSARKKGINAIKHDAETGLPYKDEVFDIIICKHVLEHLFNPQGLMGEIKRVLKDDGRIFISVPNHFYFKIRLRLLLGDNIIWPGHCGNEWDYFHIRFFTWTGFLQFIGISGFKPCKFYWASGHFASKFPKIFRIILSKLVQLKPNLLSPEFYAELKKEIVL
ncbi:MAG TPA: class I SAM-dependent methyltransferase [archaeon]|nr:class I SAM-dependent methyltransferase [archaeon]